MRMCTDFDLRLKTTDFRGGNERKREYPLNCHQHGKFFRNEKLCMYAMNGIISRVPGP